MLRLFTIVTAAAVTVIACGGSPDTGRSVRPLAHGDGSEGADVPTSQERATTTAPGPSVTRDGAAAQSPQQEAQSPQQRVDDLLQRFDQAITLLYGEPLAAGNDNDPATRAWLDVVVAGSALDREVRGRILASGRDDGVRIVPPAAGATSFVNTADAVSVQPDGSLTWTNCGFSPGVGVLIEGGEVVDDSRAVTSGRGRAITDSEGQLVLAELWDDSTDVLGADATNPCGSTG